MPVTVVVGPRNAAPVASFTVEGTDPAVGTVTGTVSASDGDGDTLVVLGTAITPKGSVLVSPEGAVAYQANYGAGHNAASDGATDADRTDTFTVYVTDRHGGLTALPVTVTIPGRNNAPTASPVIEGTDQMTGVVAGTVGGYDGDGDTLVYTLTTETTKGAVSVDSATGDFTFTPTPEARVLARALDAPDTDTNLVFSVTITDGHGGETPVQLTVPIAAVNNVPVVAAVLTGEPDPVTAVVVGHITATDSDGDTLSYGGSQISTEGGFAVSADGGFTFTPSYSARVAAGLAEEPVTKNFAIFVSDGYGGSVAVPIVVTVGTADMPVVTVGEADALTGAVAGGLAVADVDGLTFSGSGWTAKGTVNVDLSGEFLYSPTYSARLDAAHSPTAENLVDEFTVTVTDGFGGTVRVPVAVAVAPASLPGVTVGIDTSWDPAFPSYVDEGDAGVTVVPVRVVLSRASDVEVMVVYSVNSLYSATPGEDFVAETGMLVFAPGEVQAEIPVTIYGDLDYEQQEYVRVELTDVVNAVVVRDNTEPNRVDSKYIYIRNDDAV